MPNSHRPDPLLRDEFDTVADAARREPASVSPISAVLGTDPTAIRQCEPVIVRPSARCTTTSSPTTSAASARLRDTMVMPLRSNAC